VGVLGNVIFTNWKVQDLAGMGAQFTNRRNGLDFGFSSDPAAMPATHYDKKRQTIYVFRELYERGLDNEELAREVLKAIGRDLVTCDSAEPKSIAELQKYGVNAIGAEKGKDSVNFGIQWLQRQTIIIDKHCVNAKNEIQSYKWKEDKNGIAMRMPVDKNNHIIDALRYAYERDMEGFAPIPEKQPVTVSKWVEGDQTGWSKRY
jgi:phage terminase large subunit